MPRRVTGWFALASLCGALCASYGHAEPRAALKFKRFTIATVAREFGPGAPVSPIAAQIEQESSWLPTARSPAGAEGLGQHTPDTVAFLKRAYPDLRDGDTYHPHWSIRAATRYMHRLKGNLVAETECDDWAFAESGFNGGPGHVLREKNEAARRGLNRNRWWGHVATVCLRADWACDENRAYPIRILRDRQGNYRSWNRGVPLVCEGDPRIARLPRRI